MDNDRIFNLLREPWIRVLCQDGTVKEVSLTDALIQAHRFKSLAGEMATQDMAVLRLLLAVMHAVFSKTDAEGVCAPIEDADSAYERWAVLWRLGHVPEVPVRDYLCRYEDRFWLFHPEHPFYQADTAKGGTGYTAAKLNGELLESGNKIRLFASRCGDAKQGMTFAEAARWLLHVNGFDDNSAKPKGRDLPSVGAGWLGKIGLIAAEGDDLFETLMLNMVLLDEHGEPWASASPCWESAVRKGERTEIPLPYDQAALLTLQSRRLLLERRGDTVTGFRLLGGDFFDRENAFAEQMTVWKPIYEKKQRIGFQPSRHDPAKKLWRQFPTITSGADGNDGRSPGVVAWNAELQNEGILPTSRTICYSIASIRYGDKDFFVTDAFSDKISFHMNLLGSLGNAWRTEIQAEIERCEKVAWMVGRFAGNLQVAAGGEGSGEGNAEQKAKEMLYYRIDVPFRNWLMLPDASQSDAERIELQLRWQRELETIALDLGRELVEEAGPMAYVGRTVKDKEGRIRGFYSAPSDYGKFINSIRKITGRSDENDKS